MFLVKALCSMNIFCIELSQFCCMDILQNIAASAQAKKKNHFIIRNLRQTLKGKHKNPKLKTRRAYIFFFDFVV